MYEELLQIAQEKLESPLLVEYATYYFIKEITKGKNELWLTVQETVRFPSIMAEKLDESDHTRNGVYRQATQEGE